MNRLALLLHPVGSNHALLTFKFFIMVSLSGNKSVPKVTLYLGSDIYDFHSLVPLCNGVKYESKSALMRASISIMRQCNYPFDLVCPMPPVFVHGADSITWNYLSYCLWFSVTFAQSCAFENSWNPRIKWMGDSFLDSSTCSRVYNVSLRSSVSDDIISSCVCSADQLGRICVHMLDRNIKHSVVYIY